MAMRDFNLQTLLNKRPSMMLMHDYVLFRQESTKILTKIDQFDAILFDSIIQDFESSDDDRKLIAINVCSKLLEHGYYFYRKAIKDILLLKIVDLIDSTNVLNIQLECLIAVKYYSGSVSCIMFMQPGFIPCINVLCSFPYHLIRDKAIQIRRDAIKCLVVSLEKTPSVYVLKHLQEFCNADEAIDQDMVMRISRLIFRLIRLNKEEPMMVVCLEALRSIPDPFLEVLEFIDFIPAVTSLLVHDSAPVVRAAFFGLSRFLCYKNKPYAEPVMDTSETLYKEGIEILKNLSKLYQAGDEEVKCNVGLTMARIFLYIKDWNYVPLDCVRPVIEKLHDEDSDVVALALRAILKIANMGDFVEKCEVLNPVSACASMVNDKDLSTTILKLRNHDDSYISVAATLVVDSLWPQYNKRTPVVYAAKCYTSQNQIALFDDSDDFEPFPTPVMWERKYSAGG